MDVSVLNYICTVCAIVGSSIAIYQLFKTNKTHKTNISRNLTIELIEQSNSLFESITRLESLPKNVSKSKKSAHEDEVIGKLGNFTNLTELLVSYIDIKLLKETEIKIGFWPYLIKPLIWDLYLNQMGHIKDADEKFPYLFKYCTKWEEEDNHPKHNQKSTFTWIDIISLVGH